MNWLGRIAGCTLVTLAASAWLIEREGIYLNTTVSIPLGFYRSVASPVARDAFVVICPPAAGAFLVAKARGYVRVGRCRSGLLPLMKRVVATRGDRVSVVAAGVSVNGLTVAESAPMKADGQGRQMQAYSMNRVLNAEEIFLMGDHSPISFDSRYFGPLLATDVQAVVVPLATWK
ncbi:conjugative transfer signal peptidase TraF [Variovorax sp. CAN2819]|uniref:conjugative transfer signal peptidase TraF n=1 Tax=Variovorax sp. CAN15 TaxID=3046727 RepID=UPI0026497C17|nr:conjugative transfer signal peptidase TraF [Variovorax sp. CAN15]MDN6888294.1 conjugative transfer signal peptidase TraF [Variovorax sp. CAN15]